MKYYDEMKFATVLFYLLLEPRLSHASLAGLLQQEPAFRVLFAIITITIKKMMVKLVFHYSGKLRILRKVLEL